jgi:hypothetical protein
MRIALIVIAGMALTAVARAQLLTTGAGSNAHAVAPTTCTANFTGGTVSLAPTGGYLFTC